MRAANEQQTKFNIKEAEKASKKLVILQAVYTDYTVSKCIHSIQFPKLHTDNNLNVAPCLPDH